MKKGNPIIEKPVSLPTDEELVASGITLPSWEKDSVWVKQMIVDAFPNFYIGGSEDSIIICSTHKNVDISKVNNRNELVKKDEDGNSFYELASIRFTFWNGMSRPLRSDIEINVDYGGNKLAIVNWDEKIEHSLSWNRSVINRKATLHEPTVKNIIKYLKKQLK